MQEEQIKSLIKEAIIARESAYAPYSNFYVGAAIQTANGKIFTGSNIENASYGASICAERTAAVTAVHEGENEFSAICVVGWPKYNRVEEQDWCYPCGICRQFLEEFSTADTLVILAKSQEEYTTMHFSDLFPFAFEKSQLE